MTAKATAGVKRCPECFGRLRKGVCRDCEKREREELTEDEAVSISTNADFRRLYDAGWDTHEAAPTPVGVGWWHPLHGWVWSEQEQVSQGRRHGPTRGVGPFRWYARADEHGPISRPFGTIWQAIAALSGGRSVA